MVGHPLKIKDIISELTRGGVCIPEIQRSYVWKRSQIAKLLDSIYRSYPTGSILLWDTIQPIQMREMATTLGRQVQPDFNPKIVLDGQQRLTSLGRGLWAVERFEDFLVARRQLLADAMNQVLDGSGRQSEAT